MQAVQRDQDAGILQRLRYISSSPSRARDRASHVRRRRLIARGDHQHHESHGGVSFDLLPSFRGRETNPNLAQQIRSWVQPCGLPCEGSLLPDLGAGALPARAIPARSASQIFPPRTPDGFRSSEPPSNARFIQSMASSSDLVLINQKPATRLPVRPNGPRSRSVAAGTSAARSSTAGCDPRLPR